jgi:hypothetical protein
LNCAALSSNKAETKVSAVAGSRLLFGSIFVPYLMKQRPEPSRGQHGQGERIPRTNLLKSRVYSSFACVD